MRTGPAGLLRRRGRGVGRADRLAGRPTAIRRAASTRRCRARARSSPTTSLFAAFAFVVLLGTVFPLIVEAVNGDAALGRRAVLQPHDHADRPGPAAADGGRSGAAVAQGDGRTAARAAVVAGRGRGGRGGARRRPRCRRRRPRCWRSASVGSRPARRAARLALATRRQGFGGLVGRANGGMIVHLGVIIIARRARGVVGVHAPGRVHPRGGRDGACRRSHRRIPRTADGRAGQPRRARRPHPGRRRPRLRARDSTSTADRPDDRDAVGPGRASVRTCSWRCTGARREADPSVGLRVIVQPMVMWLWVGGVVMVVGTALSLFPGRRRNPLDAGVGARSRRADRRGPTVTAGRPMTSAGPADRSDDDRGREPEPAPVAT